MKKINSWQINNAMSLMARFKLFVMFTLSCANSGQRNWDKYPPNFGDIFEARSQFVHCYQLEKR